MKIPPLNLTAALAGYPVRLRDGGKAFIRWEENNLECKSPWLGYVCSKQGPWATAWTTNGYIRNDETAAGGDIVGMWVEKPTFEHWHLLNPAIRFISFDKECLTWTGFSEEPLPTTAGDWRIPFNRGTTYSLEGFDPGAFPKCNWEDSLIKRPEE